MLLVLDVQGLFPADFAVRNTIRSKTHKRLKEHFLTRQNRTKRTNFRGNPLFQATHITTENS